MRTTARAVFLASSINLIKLQGFSCAKARFEQNIEKVLFLDLNKYPQVESIGMRTAYLMRGISAMSSHLLKLNSHSTT
jgi:hypothetical protein